MLLFKNIISEPKSEFLTPKYLIINTLSVYFLFSPSIRKLGEKYVTD